MSLIKICASLLFIYVVLIGAMYVMQRNLIYFPWAGAPDIQAYKQDFPDLRSIRVTTSDGLKLDAWYLPPGTGKDPVILLFHGNASSYEYSLSKAGYYQDKGYGFLLAGYRGYSGNPGNPTEEGLYRDGRAYMDWLTSQRGIPQGRIIVYGESLGGGVAVQMAKEYPGLLALILEVPFLSAYHVAKNVYPFIPFPGLLLKDDYRNDLKIEEIDCPKLFLLAGRDEVIPKSLGKKLYDMAPEPKTLWIAEAAEHNTVYAYNADRAVKSFISGLSADRGKGE